MKNPAWFDQKAAHKNFRAGTDCYVPICKMWKREEFPSSGVWDKEDIVKRNWKDVTCKMCLDFLKETKRG